MLSRTPSAEAGPSDPRRLRTASLVLFILLAVVHTWPLASAPATLSRNDTVDFHPRSLMWFTPSTLRGAVRLGGDFGKFAVVSENVGSGSCQQARLRDRLVVLPASLERHVYRLPLSWITTGTVRLI